MRVSTSLFALIALLLSSVTDARIKVNKLSKRSNADALTSRNNLHLKQMSRKELEYRASPELYYVDKREDPTPTDGSGGGGSDPCQFGKRDIHVTKKSHVGEIYILKPEEAAGFMMGYGTVTLMNGTVYHDSQYSKKHPKQRKSSNPLIKEKRGVYRTLTDALGNKFLDVSVPYYKKIKRQNKPGKLAFLSPNTAIDVGRLPEFETALLADPEFSELRVMGFRITRKFFEAARID